MVPVFDQLDLTQLNLNVLYHQLSSLQLPSLAITSAELGEGKTTICYALANIALKDKKRVLIIDLDSANPTLSNEFCSPELQEVTLDKWNTCSSKLPGLDILPAPQDPHMIFQLIKEKTLAEVIVKVSKGYDQVLIDCPAINDPKQNTIPAPLIASAASGVAVVVMSGKTLLIELEQAMSQLLREGPRLIGAIMNDKVNPGLLTELIRETHRFDQSCPSLMAKLRDFLKKQPLLNIEI